MLKCLWPVIKSNIIPVLTVIIATVLSIYLFSLEGNDVDYTNVPLFPDRALST